MSTEKLRGRAQGWASDLDAGRYAQSRHQLEAQLLRDLCAENERLEKENGAFREGILSLCKAYCAGREAYSGKNRHEPNCAAWEFDDALRGEGGKE